MLSFRFSLGTAILENEKLRLRKDEFARVDVGKANFAPGRATQNFRKIDETFIRWNCTLSRRVLENKADLKINCQRR